MNSPHYTTHQRTTRAASANHTEAGVLKSDRIPAYVPATPRPFAFQEGDEVVVSDEDHILNGTTGRVTNRWAGVPHRYTVKFHWSDTAIQGFRETQLRKVQIKSAPSALLVISTYRPVPRVNSNYTTRDDCVMVMGRVFHLDDPEAIRLLKKERKMKRETEIEMRRIKKTVITPKVICLPAPSPETRAELARQKFDAFMALCEREYPTSALFVQSLDNPKPSLEYRQNARKQGKAQRSAKTRTKPQGQPKSRKSPKIIEMPQLRIRRYA